MGLFVINPVGMAELEFTGGPVDHGLRLKAELVATAAKRFCPVDTGRLEASITVLPGHDSQGLMCLVGSNVTYAIYQELGTRFQTGTPFLRPALYGPGGY